MHDAPSFSVSAFNTGKLLVPHENLGRNVAASASVVNAVKAIHHLSSFCSNMAPPAKRQKQDTEPKDEHSKALAANKTSLAKFLVSPKSKPSSLQPLPTRAKITRSLTNSPSTSPEKPRKKPIFDEEKGKSKDLRSLFSRAVAQPKRKATESSSFLYEHVDHDSISDGDDDEISYAKASSTSLVGKNAKKRLKIAPSHATSTSTTNSGAIFLKPPPLPQRSKSPRPDDDLRPWSERFSPNNLDELAVHKKKVSDVRQWLDAVLAGNSRQRLLVLKGATGTGKTTTVRLLARDLQSELLEWRNPPGPGLQFVSFSAQFGEFMGRGAKFGQLDVETESCNSQAPARTWSRSAAERSSRRMILIEEFPNTFVKNSTALIAFRQAILEFLATHTPSLAAHSQQPLKEPITPVVMVISENLLTTTSSSADSFTAHRLLGPEILHHPGAGVIEFNNVAPSILAKALELVVVKEARKSGRKRTPGPQVLKKLGEIGDIRSAISALEFLCIKGDNEADWGAKVAFTKPKRPSRQSQGLTKSEEASLELITQREASLGIFHAVGKVVYNKREELPFAPDAQKMVAETAPPHLSDIGARLYRSLVSVDALIDETGTDTSTFISALHENYALSCTPSGREDVKSSSDYVSDCIECLSMSDILCPSWDVFFGGQGPSGGFKDTGSHMLRQDEIAFHVAVRGLLHYLPYPVKRLPSASRRGSDAFKMFFPTSIKLWRAKEEMEGIIDTWSSKLLKGEEDGQHNFKGIMEGALAFRRARPPAVDPWAAGQKAGRHRQDKGGDGSALLSLGSSARKEMVLERLPYMAQMARGCKGRFNSIGVRDIDKVVSFRSGLHVTDDSEAEDESCGGQGESWATDKPSEELLPRNAKDKILDLGGGEMQGAVGQKLYLSDDDIED